MIEQEQQASQQRLADQGLERVLAVQDTTSFSFAQRQVVGLGVLEDNRTTGFFAHTTLAVSEVGVPLGLLDQQVWVRTPPASPQPDDAHKQVPITAKESNKWLVGLAQSVTHAPVHQVVTVCDREGDIYELFASAQAQDAYFVVRMAHNRRTDDGVLVDQGLAEQGQATTFTLCLPRRPQSAPQTVTMQLRYATLTLLPPKRHTQARSLPLTPLVVQVVEALELGPPPDATPLHWRLVSNLPLNDAQDAHTLLRYYSYRWLVERFHYVLKSGCHFEESQLTTFAALTNHLALCSSVAWRLLWLTYQARLTPDASCEVALPRPTWQALMAFIRRTPNPPPQPPSLREAVRAIAMLGGFLGRKRDGEPGVKTLWRGLIRLDDIVATYSLFLPKDVGKD
jgi:hypothetical protein